MTGQEGGISKDTWILASESVSWAAAQELAHAPLHLNRQQGPLPGYATENLFRFGRYQERLACQTRVWREVLAQSMEWYGPIPAAEPDWTRFLRVYQPASPLLTADPRALEAKLEHSLRDELSMGSPAFNRAAMRRTARAVRDLLPDDCWLAVHALMQPASAAIPDDGSEAGTDYPDAAETRKRLDQAILEPGGMAGLESESIALGPVRRFIRMGRSVERAQCTARMLAAGLGRNLKPTDALLMSLLAVHDSDLMYRHRYQREIQPGAVADLLLADELNPRSIAYQLARFAEELAQLPLAESSLLSSCRKTVLKALTSVRMWKPEAEGGSLRDPRGVRGRAGHPRTLPWVPPGPYTVEISANRARNAGRRGGPVPPGRGKRPGAPDSFHFVSIGLGGI